MAGSWSRGKSRTNQIEAEAIVKEVVRRLTDTSLADAKGHFPSIAVITLNAEQQKLIEDLLDKARAQNPAIEPFFAEDASEPVVVKNLETVQGDERDIVLLGIGYGPETPDAPSMPMNFGPLNRAGGWRRLNVAITRARREMLVYTSFPPHLIDLNRTASEALRDLKHFLEFAEQGPRALGQAIAGSLGGYESPFEEAVAEGLRNLGWSIVPQVGVSRYRVDLGIVHPDRPGDYLVGVECDGAMYHSAATARDRDKVRESVLRQLGWKLLRVWSTDWWIDRKAALQQLHARLEVLLTERRDTDQETERKRLGQEALAESAEQFVNLGSLDLSSPVGVSERIYPELSAESRELVLEEFKNSYPDMKSVEGPAKNLEPSGEQVFLVVEEEPAQQFSPLDGQNSFTSPASSVPVEQLPIATTSFLQTANEPNSTPSTFQQGVYRATAFDDVKSLLQPDQFFEASYSMRKTYKGLADFELVTREIFGNVYGMAARYNAAEHVWRFPNNGYLEFGQLESHADYAKYQGRSFTLLIVDEAGQYAAPDLLDVMRSNLRGPKNVPIRMVIAANPGGPGHHWIAKRYVFVCAPWEMFYEARSKRRWVHAPSTFAGNTFIDRDQYREQLESSCPDDPELLRAWIEGDWAVNRGAYFASCTVSRIHSEDRAPRKSCEG